VTRHEAAPERADGWISRTATATVAGLAGIAGAISYSHMRQLAAVHGDTGWHAHAFPLSVDGVEVVASLVLLADRQAGRRSGWLPWAALTIGTAASLAANIATADHGTISRIIAGWPAVALLIAVKLLSGILEHRTTQPVPGTAPARSTSPGTGNAEGARNSETARTRPTSARPALSSRSAAVATRRPPVTAPATVPVPGTANLMAAARAAQDALSRDGQPLTRDALAARLRQAGYPVRYSRLTPLLQARRADLSRRLLGAGAERTRPRCGRRGRGRAGSRPGRLARWPSCRSTGSMSSGGSPGWRRSRVRCRTPL
jgi:hypothetical protein